MGNSKFQETFNSRDGISLREYIDNKVGDMKDKIELQFAANKTALDKAELATNLRLESMNEFRNAMKDQSSHFLTKEEYEIRHQNLIDKIDALQKIIWLGLGVVLAIDYLIKFVK